MDFRVKLIERDNDNIINRFFKLKGIVIMICQAFNNIVSYCTKQILSQSLEETEKSMLKWEVLKYLNQELIKRHNE